MNAHPDRETFIESETVDTVGVCARLALQENGGDASKAIAALAARVRRDTTLRTAILDPLVEYACNQAVMREIRVNRGNVWQPPSPERLDRMSDSDRVKALAAGNLLMFPLPGGKRLGEASGSEITTAAQFYERQAGDMAHKARWLHLVAKRLPEGKLAGNVLRDADLRALQAEAAKHG